MRRSADFSSTVRSGVRTGRHRLVVHLLPPSDTERPAGATVGFVVSKAVGGAVERNQVKRRLRHLMASRLNCLPDGARVVVRALPAATDATSVELGRDLDAALTGAISRLGARAPMSPRSSR